MKKWRILVLTMLALLLAAMSPMVVLAQSDEAALTSDTPPANGALAIIAPWVTNVGQETSMRVFLLMLFSRRHRELSILLHGNL